MDFNSYLKFTHILQDLQRLSFKIMAPIIYLWTAYVLYCLYGTLGLIGGLLLPIISTIAAVILSLLEGYKAFPFFIIGFLIYAFGLPLSLIVFRMFFVTHDETDENS